MLVEDEPQGAAEHEDDEGPFRITLGFAAAVCPGCGTPAEPGPCLKCGAEVPPTEETNELVEARRGALGSFADEARRLIDAFDAIPRGRVPVSPDQFLTALGDAELFARVGEMSELGHQLARVDFDDSWQVGVRARQLVSGQLERVRELLGICQELSIFAPEGPGAELQQLAIDAGRYGARVVAALVRVVTVPTITEARAGERELGELLSGFPPGESLDELLSEIDEWPLRDVDARIGLALNRPGRYTDDFGFPDLARIFGAYANAEQPFLVLAERARHYFIHLLRSPADESGREALLVLPAVTLAALDRPLVPHRIAMLTTELLGEAWSADQEAVQALIERTTAEGPLLFAAASRVYRGLRLLMAGDEAGLVDDETALREVMDTYRELGESLFRTAAWLVLDLGGVARGQTISGSGQAPMLGELEQRLRAADHPLARQLAQSADSALRNAAGHAQYRWDAEQETVRDLRTGKSWPADTLEERVASLVGALAGLDAGYSCFLLDGEVELEPPSWLSAGEAPHANELFASAALGAFGFRVAAVAPDGSEIALEDVEDIDALRLFPPLGGLFAIFSEVEAIRVVRAADEEVIVDVSAEAMREASSTAEEFRDLAVLAPFLSAAERGHRDADEALLDVLATQLAVVVLTALPKLQGGAVETKAIRSIARRLGYVHQFGKRRAAKPDVRTRRLLDRIGRAQGSARVASFGDLRAARRLFQQLAGLLQWADGHGVRWPPL